MRITTRAFLPLLAALFLVGVGFAQERRASPPPMLFETADQCQACHNGLTTPSGEDVSFGTAWRTTMMANAARDPYWHAAVRREVLEHPAEQHVIEGECSKCHMPMARVEAAAAGGEGRVFANLPAGTIGTRPGRLAADGVSCAVCHQITPDKLGTRESFVGGFAVDTAAPWGQRKMFGPFDIDQRVTTVMHSATSFTPTQAMHIQSSEVCATCHSLFTHALAPGSPKGEMPEQVPYQEWERSIYKETKSCQSCHMPLVTEDVPIASVVAQPRSGVARHTFVGGNFFMMRILARYGGELGAVAAPAEFEAAAARTIDHLQREAATLVIERAAASDNELALDLLVTNPTGHKLPTAYPSRRMWVHLQVRNAAGRVVFESGAVRRDGAIAGNANDETATEYEPHYIEITRPDQVQIYEAVMGDAAGVTTTGLLTAVRFIKDNRVLPRGFDNATAPAEVAVQGSAAADGDFAAGSDRVRYRLPLARTDGPFQVEAELRYQSIGFRWAENLRRFGSAETARFVRYYESLSDVSTVALASVVRTVP
jgi:hypothetical protein